MRCVVGLICLLLLGGNEALFAQHYTGMVLDKETGRPIDAASVYLLSADSLIVSYTYTDSQGRFNLPDADASLLSFSSLGYKTFLVAKSEFTNDQSILLQPTDIQLREVEVTTNRLYETGDTLIYNVSGFKLPQDRNIADVLRKLPGITVAENGQIQYQGEAINRFYIEGLDLLGDKYNLASSNLKADYVKEIQVLQDHQPVKTLRGVQFSEQAALNLVLTEDAKAKWLAGVDLGLGAAPFLWNNRVLATVFKKNAQNLSMYKNDNTGSAIASELTSLRVEDLAYLQLLPKESQGVFRPEQWNSPPLDLHRYLFNKSHLFTTNQLFRTSEESDVRIQFSYLNNRLENKKNTEWNYFMADSVLSISEQIDEHEMQNDLEGFLVFTQNKADFFLKNKLSMRARLRKKDRTLYTNQNLIAEKYKTPDYYLRNEFHLVKPVGGNTWNLQSIIQTDCLPQHLEFTPGLYAGFLNLDFNYSGLRQNADIKEFLSHQLLSFNHQLKKLKMTYEMGAKADRRRLSSYLSVANTSDVDWRSSEFANTTRLDEYSVYFSPQLRFQQNKLSLNAVLKMAYYRFDPYKENLFALQPRITLTYMFTNWWDMRFRFSEDRRPFSLENMYTNYLFTNYRKVERSTGWFSPSKNRDYVWTTAYRNPVKGYFIQGGVTYQEIEKNGLNDLMYDGLLQKKQTVRHDYQQRNLQAMLNTSKSFATLNTRLFLDLHWMKSKAGQLSDGKFLRFTNQSYTLETKAIIQPSKWFNAEYKLYWSAFELKMKDFLSSSTNYFRHNLSLNILPSKAWQFNINPVYYHGDAGCVSNLFVDAYASYRWKNNELILSASHIGSNGTYEHHSFNSLTETVTSHKTRPMQILIKYAFNL